MTDQQIENLAAEAADTLHGVRKRRARYAGIIEDDTPKHLDIQKKKV